MSARLRKTNLPITGVHNGKQKRDFCCDTQHIAPKGLSLVALCAQGHGETLRLWRKSGVDGDRGGLKRVSLFADGASQRFARDFRKLLRALAFYKKKPMRSASACLVNPRVTKFRTSGKKVAGTGFEPVTSRL